MREGKKNLEAWEIETIWRCKRQNKLEAKGRDESRGERERKI